jgi:hypothetical protein
VNKQPDRWEADRPQARVAYGHPVTTGARYRFSDHKPGHDESSAAVQVPDVSGKRSGRAEIPPQNAAKVHKTSLSERIRRGLTGNEKKT